MPKKKQPTGKHPDENVGVATPAAEPTEEQAAAEWNATGKATPVQVDWGVDETGEPQPSTPTGCEEAVATQSDAEAADPDTFGPPVEEDDWQQVAVPLTLDIQRHSGKFDPDIVKMLVYGETGTQKTRFASTWPNVIFADVDHGMASVAEQVDKVWVHDDERGFEELSKLHEFLATGNHNYQAVVLDTLNEMQRVIMRFTVEEYTHIRRSYGNLPGQSDYGKMLYEFMELTRNFIALPMRVVLLAQVNSQAFESDTLGPQLIGKNTARELSRKMDVIGYIFKQDSGTDEKMIPAMAFDSAQYVTKDRSNRLPAVLPNPTFNRMQAFWR